MKQKAQSSFTLVELLVVAAIISLLAAMLLPALRNAKDTATSSQCMANVRQWWLAITLFAGENDGRYPVPMYNSGNGGWRQLVQPYFAPTELQLSRVVCPEGARIAGLPATGGPNWWYLTYNDATHYHYIAPPGNPTRVIFNGAYLINYYAIYGGWIVGLTAPPSVEDGAPYSFRLGRHKFPAETALLLEGVWGGNWGFYFNGNTLTNIMQLAHIEWRHRKGRLMNVCFVDGHVSSLTKLPGAPSSGPEGSKFWRGVSDGDRFLDYNSID